MISSRVTKLGGDSLSKILATIILALSITFIGVFAYYGNELKVAEESISNLHQEQKLNSTEIAKLEDVIKTKDETIAEKDALISEKSDYIANKIKELKEKNSKINRLEVKLKDMKKPSFKVEAPKTTISRGSNKGGKTINVSATAYTAYCNGCSGITRTGIDLRANPSLKVIAVDPRVIPLGTKVHVEGYGYAIAGDTGGAIKGSKIDVFIPNVAAMREWGRKNVVVTILE